MRRSGLIWSVCLVLGPMLASAASGAEEPGRALYMERCFWCHGDEGRGDGPSAIGMIPRARDFVRADYKIRSTPHGQLPTDEDLFRMISKGLPGTPMPGWEKILTDQELRQLVSYLKSLSPRFETETREPLSIPSSPASVEQGREVHRQARCFTCHGEAGRGDGEITATLNFQWGMPYSARDFSRGWTFKGGNEPREIYLRITGGINGTPMGPYQELLSDQERWDLAHYIASLDAEPSQTTADFVITAALIEGDIPAVPDAPEWERVASILVPLAGQVTLDPPSRWWTPTAGTAALRALWNGREIAFLLEWNDPTGADSPFPDSALLQFPANPGSKPYFLFGDADNPVTLWQWRAGEHAELETATGPGTSESQRADFQAHAVWKEGRWQVILRRSLEGEPSFEPGKFIATLVSVRDGANAEVGNVRAISTWLYTTLERPRSARPWLRGLAYLLGTVIVHLWILGKLKS